MLWLSMPRLPKGSTLLHAFMCILVIHKEVYLRTKVYFEANNYIKLYKSSENGLRLFFDKVSTSHFVKTTYNFRENIFCFTNIYPIIIGCLLPSSPVGLCQYFFNLN